MTQHIIVGSRLNLGDNAPDISLTATDGRSIQLASLWNGSPLILAFLRHFG